MSLSPTPPFHSVPPRAPPGAQSTTLPGLNLRFRVIRIGVVVVVVRSHFVSLPLASMPTLIIVDTVRRFFRFILHSIAFPLLAATAAAFGFRRPGCAFRLRWFAFVFAHPAPP